MMKNERSIDEEIELYKKINQTIYLIVSINRALKRRDYITINLLNDQLISNYEELTALPLQSSYKELLEYKSRVESYLLDKCPDDHEKRSDIIYADNLEYLITSEEKDEERFDLLTMCDDDYSWWIKLLNSNLGIERLSNMYIDILTMTYDPNRFIDYVQASDSKNISDKIIKYINENPSIKNDVFKKLANTRPRIIGILQDRKLVDFTSCYIDRMDAVSYMFNTSNFDVFKSLFNGLSEKEKEDFIIWVLPLCYNNQQLLINTLKLDFEVTEEIINYLSEDIVDRISDSLNELDEKEEAYNEGRTAWSDNTFNEYRDRVLNSLNSLSNIISDTLIRKASNKKQYKLYKKYADEFLANADSKKMFAEREIEKEKERQELELLNNKRSEFTTVIYNLNDKLQDEVPGKTRIKTINFKKLS